MAFWYLQGLLMFATGLLPRRTGRRRLRVRVPTGVSSAIAPMGALALAVIYAWQRHIFDAAVDAQPDAESSSSLPLRIFSFHSHIFPDPAVASAEAVLSALASAALAALAYGIRFLSRIQCMTIVAATAATLLALSFASSAADSPDPYLYVGYALLGRRAFHPPTTPFGGEFVAISRIWGTPLMASVYGPLFLVIDSAVTAPMHDLAAKILALRVLGGSSVLVAAFLVRALGLPRGVVVAVACNPGFYDIFVASAHNDLIAVDFALGAILALRRRRIALAAFLGACAGLVKVTLSVVALLGASSLTKLPERLQFAVSVVVLIVAGMALGGAADYISLARAAAADNPVTYGAIELTLQSAAGVVAAWCVFSSVLFGRATPTGAWSFIALGQWPMAQYASWGLPCAIENRDVGLVFLLQFPVVATLLEPRYPVTPVAQAVAVSVCLFGIFAMLGYRPRKAPTKSAN